MISTSVNLLTDKEKLAKTAYRYLSGYEVSMVIIDTMSQAIAGADENSAAEMSKMISCINYVKERVNSHVCLVHHCGKDVERGMRGSSVIKGAIDTEIAISHDFSTRMSCAKVAKQKDLELTGEFNFKLKKGVVGSDDSGKIITSCTVEHLDEKEAAEVKPKVGRTEKCSAMDLVALLDEPKPTIKAWKQAAKEKFDIGSTAFDNKRSELELGTHYSKTAAGYEAIKQNSEESIAPAVE